MKFKVIDGCPVPAALAAELHELKRLTGATLVSCDRSPAAEPILRRNGKQSQRQLYEGFRAGRPGYNPANPPNRSTHERRSDGVAYRGPAGRPLRYWQVGMDWSDSRAIVRAASQRRWTASVTYPGNPREGHHVNFRRAPRLRVIRPLKRGSRGLRVAELTHRLAFVREPGSTKNYLPHAQRTFDSAVAKAVRAFQRDHSQHPDGIVGAQTTRQLAASVRHEKQRRRKARR